MMAAIDLRMGPPRTRRSREARRDGPEPIFSTLFGRLALTEINPWQDGKDPLNTAFPDVLALAGASVLAFRKRTNRRLFLSGHSVRMVRKEGKLSFIGKRAGADRLAGALRSCPRLQAPEINVSFSMA
jgi:hypothetical protein